MFFYEIEGHMQKLSSFRWVKKIYGLKSHLGYLLPCAGTPSIQPANKTKTKSTKTSDLHKKKFIS